MNMVEVFDELLGSYALDENFVEGNVSCDTSSIALTKLIEPKSATWVADMEMHLFSCFCHQF